MSCNCCASNLTNMWTSDQAGLTICLCVEISLVRRQNRSCHLSDYLLITVMFSKWPVQKMKKLFCLGVILVCTGVGVWPFVSLFDNKFLCDSLIGWNMKLAISAQTCFCPSVECIAMCPILSSGRQSIMLWWERPSSSFCWWCWYCHPSGWPGEEQILCISFHVSWQFPPCLWS